MHKVGVPFWPLLHLKGLELLMMHYHFTRSFLSRAYCFRLPEAKDDLGYIGSSVGLNTDLLLAAYIQGVFPWSEDPVHWYAPLRRGILWARDYRMPKNLPKIARRMGFEVGCDRDFRGVMEGCCRHHGRLGETWIGPELVEAYCALHERGFAHSMEVYQEGKLVGGLYGVQLGRYFSGESMFHTVTGASKVALGAAVYFIEKSLGIEWLGCGAIEISREAFIALLDASIPEDIYSTERWPREIRYWRNGC
jgi:leucyl/phenylalanyl-tRNA--protein transferase